MSEKFKEIDKDHEKEQKSMLSVIYNVFLTLSLISLFSSSWATRSWTNIITLDWPTTRARAGWIRPAFHKRNSNLSFFFTVNLSLFLTVHFQWITISYVHLLIILFCFWPIKQKVSVLCRILIENELLLEFISNSSKIHFGPKSHFLLEISTCSFDSLLEAPPCPLWALL